MLTVFLPIRSQAGVKDLTSSFFDLCGSKKWVWAVRNLGGLGGLPGGHSGDPRGNRQDFEKKMSKNHLIPILISGKLARFF